MTFDPSELQRFKLLGGANAAELWPVINLILPAWFLLVFAPRWKHTQTVTLIPPIVHAMIYVGAIFSVLLYPPQDKPPASMADLSTLQGVYEMFRDPNGVFIGWEHYVCFDLLVGRMISIHSVIMNVSLVFHIFVVIPSLVLTLMMGPTGWLYYLVMSTMLLDEPAVAVPVAPTRMKTKTKPAAKKSTESAPSKKNKTNGTKSPLKVIPESPQKNKKSSPQKNQKNSSPGKRKKA